MRLGYHKTKFAGMRQWPMFGFCDFGQLVTTYWMFACRCKMDTGTCKQQHTDICKLQGGVCNVDMVSGRHAALSAPCDWMHPSQHTQDFCRKMPHSVVWTLHPKMLTTFVAVISRQDNLWNCETQQIKVLLLWSL